MQISVKSSTIGPFLTEFRFRGTRAGKEVSVAMKLAKKPAQSAFGPTNNLETVNNVVYAEKHYSVLELAQLWNLSEQTIRRMFANEPGVLRWGRREGRFKRGYTTTRIPETVVLRVRRRLETAG
jgi:hypothetical protein